MNKQNRVLLAPLIRGLLINAMGEPVTAVSGACEKEDIPAGALTADLRPVLREASFREEDAAMLLKEVYAAWEFEMGSAGGAADKEGVKKYPSCIALRDDGEELSLFWIDRDYDRALKRRDIKDASLLEGRYLRSPVPDGICGQGASSLGREEVVKNRIALVTGGAQGFGEEIVRGLAASGALVYIADLNLDGAKVLADELNAALKRTAAIPLEVNVADEDSVKAMFAAVAETTGGLDLCVSNAGVLRAGSVLEQELGDFKFVTDINYTGFFLVSKHCGRILRRQHLSARNWTTDIIQINSKSGLEGSNKNGAYAGGKFGGIGLAASFALELVAYNIKVNAVCPGNFYDGPLWSDPEKGLFVQYLNTGKVPGAKSIEDVRAFYEAKVPMKRGCTGADVMRAIYYIVEQEYETGQAVPVSGGQVMLH
ncbi:SDR family NAD(P)-dependent oxidoreductase [Treponema sp. OttesenSCG-928-L16]|nr:SDR family NAD(P)-dependent oxidoreductase [Treponema sp. OttesenSCG-928-L16]